MEKINTDYKQRTSGLNFFFSGFNFTTAQAMYNCDDQSLNCLREFLVHVIFQAVYCICVQMPYQGSGFFWN